MDEKIIPNHDSLSYLDKSAVQPLPEHDKYQALSIEEDRERTNLHYEQPPEFFLTMTGGEWNAYSCNLWPEVVTTETRSQEVKFDLFAQLMELKPGMRILEVGCGWGGPMTYLSKTYGVEAVGLTLSTLQKQAAEDRIARYGANASVQICHWQEFEDAQGFDAIYTDEVIVHFYHLGDFFKKVHALLKPNGIMLNKEAHYGRSAYKEPTRAEIYVNEIYGFTGNYRMFHEELALMDAANFDLIAHQTVPRPYYQKTMDCWGANLYAHRERLIALVGKETYLRFRAYIKLVRHMMNTPVATIDIAVGRKM